SRRRHTRSDRDWSSDVCSSDLGRWLSGRKHPPAKRVGGVKLPRGFESLPSRQSEVPIHAIAGTRGLDLFAQAAAAGTRGKARVMWREACLPPHKWLTSCRLATPSSC